MGVIFYFFHFPGVEKRPKSIASRVVAVAWIIFVLDTLFIYLAALVTNAPLYYGSHTITRPLPFTDLASLAESENPVVALRKYQDAIKSDSDPALIELAPSITYVDSNADAVAMVKSDGGDDYVFLAESFVADYYSANDCDLVSFGGVVATNTMRFGVETGSPLDDTIGMALLRLMEDGTVHQIFEKWLNKEDSTCEDYVPGAVDEANEKIPDEVVVSMDEYGGVVVSFIVALLIALVVAAMEVVFLQKKSKVSGQSGQSNKWYV